MSQDQRRYLDELLKNQLWQSLNFVAKAAFLVLLTPLMMAKWGAEGFGLFALASSLLVSMSLLDGGVRSLTRLRLAEAIRESDDRAFRRAYSEGLFTFASVVALACLASAALAATGELGRWLNLAGGGEWVLVLTVILSGILMITLLALEPLAAQGRLSELKSANTWGAVIAIPLVAILVWAGCPVVAAVAAYSLCLIVPNLLLASKEKLFRHQPWRVIPGPGTILRTLRSGIWYYLTTVALVGKTHALTFLVSGMAGPAEAGIFYVLLRISEMVGNVGATASETSLAALAAAPAPADRKQCFIQSWRYASLFCLHGAAVLGFLGDDLVHLWLAGASILPHGTGWALALFGLSGAFSRVVVNAAMGLQIVRSAALANLAEALADILLAAAGYHYAGLPGLFVGGSLGIVFLAGPARNIARLAGSNAWGLYARPLGVLLKGVVPAGLAMAVAGALSSPAWWFGALAIAGVIGLLQLRGLHRQG